MSVDGTQPDGDAPAGPLAGERLAEARRLRQISLPDIARELHLDEPKVQALEENRFEMLGAPVFARGHLRKYAELVGVPVDAVMADYRVLTNADIAPPVVGEVRQRSREINIAPWLLAIPLFLLIVGAAYWWLNRTPAPSQPSQPAATQPGVSSPVVTRPEQRAPAAGDSLESNDAAAGEAEGEVADERLPASPPALAESAPVADNAAPQERATAIAGQVELQLRFSGDCWTEVTDANGRRLFFDLGKSGRTVNVTGTAPLRVLLGDSNNVRLTVNGAPFPVENAEFRGDTARLTINE